MTIPLWNHIVPYEIYHITVLECSIGKVKLIERKH